MTSFEFDCAMRRTMFMLFWFVIWGNNSVSACALTSALLLYQRTFCIMHKLQLIVLLLKLTISKSIVQDYGAPLVSTLYIRVLYLNIILGNVFY